MISSNQSNTPFMTSPGYFANTGNFKMIYKENTSLGLQLLKLIFFLPVLNTFGIIPDKENDCSLEKENFISLAKNYCKTYIIQGWYGFAVPIPAESTN